jgi:hypothetical protein
MPSGKSADSACGMCYNGSVGSNVRSPSQIGKDRALHHLRSNSEISCQQEWLPTSIPSRSVRTSPPDRIIGYLTRRFPTSSIILAHSIPSLLQTFQPQMQASTLQRSSKHPKASWDCLVSRCCDVLATTRPIQFVSNDATWGSHRTRRSLGFHRLHNRPG